MMPRTRAGRCSTHSAKERTLDPKQQDPCDYEQQEWELDHGRDWLLYLAGAAAVAYLVSLAVILFG